MAKEYNVGDRLYLPVWVTEKETNLMMGPDKSTMITDAKFSYAYWHGKTGEGKVRYGDPGLLLTTEEVAEEYKDKAQRKIETLTKQLEEANETIKAFSESEDIVRTNFDAKVDENKELKSRNAELEALLKEVTATRDEAIRQNNELITKNNELEDANRSLTKACSEWQTAAQAHFKTTEKLREENKKLKADCNEWKDTANERLNAVQTLSADRNKLMASNAELKEWYDEANKTASEAAEANDELKAKIAELRAENEKLKADLTTQKNLAQEWHDKAHSTAKGLEELKGRYDELDSVNHEQAEKIRKLDKALTDLKQQNDKLQDENTNLSFLLEAQPEEESTKTLHVVLNDGTEIEFRRYTSYDYRTDINMFVVKDGEKYIAGFLRGDKPTNIAYWWTE